MLNFLLFLMLNIRTATQSDRLFVASYSLFYKDCIIDISSQNGWRYLPDFPLNFS